MADFRIVPSASSIPKQSDSRDVRSAAEKGWYTHFSKPKTSDELKEWVHKHANHPNGALGMIFALGRGNLAHDGSSTAENGLSAEKGCDFWLEAYDTGLIGTLPSVPLASKTSKTKPMDEPGCLFSGKVRIKLFKNPTDPDNVQADIWRVMRVRGNVPRPSEQGDVKVWFPMWSWLNYRGKLVVPGAGGSPVRTTLVPLDRQPVPFASFGYREAAFNTILKAWEQTGDPDAAAKVATRDVAVRLFAQEDLGTRKPDQLVAQLKNGFGHSTIKLEFSALLEAATPKKPQELRKAGLDPKVLSDGLLKAFGRKAEARPTMKFLLGYRVQFFVAPSRSTIRKDGVLNFHFRDTQTVAVAPGTPLNTFMNVSLTIYDATNTKRRKVKTGWKAGVGHTWNECPFPETGTFRVVGKWTNDETKKTYEQAVAITVVEAKEALESALQEKLSNTPDETMTQLRRQRSTLMDSLDYHLRKFPGPLVPAHQTEFDTLRDQIDTAIGRLKLFLKDNRDVLYKGTPISTTTGEPGGLIYMPRPVTRCKAYLVPDRDKTMPPIELRVCLVEADPKDGDAHGYTLVDWTHPPPSKSQGEFAGLSGAYYGGGDHPEAAMTAAVGDWAGKTHHPKGLLAIYIDASVGARTGFTLHRDCFNILLEVQKWAREVAEFAGTLGLLLLPLPGSRLAAALILASLAASTTESAISIVDRHMAGFTDWDKDVFDGLTIVSNLMTAGEAGVLLKTGVWTRQAGIHTLTRRHKKALEFFMWGQITSEGMQGALLIAKYSKQLEDLLEDGSIGPAGRMRESLKLLHQATITLGMGVFNLPSSTKGYSNIPPQRIVDMRSKSHRQVAVDPRPKRRSTKSPDKKGDKHRVETGRSGKAPVNTGRLNKGAKITVPTDVRLKRVTSKSPNAKKGVDHIKKRMGPNADGLLDRLNTSIAKDADLDDVLSFVHKQKDVQGASAGQLADVMYDFRTVKPKDARKAIELDVAGTVDRPMVKDMDKRVPKDGTLMSADDLSDLKAGATLAGERHGHWRAAVHAYEDTQRWMKSSLGKLDQFGGSANDALKNQLNAHRAGSLESSRLGTELRSKTHSELDAYMMAEHSAGKCGLIVNKTKSSLPGGVFMEQKVFQYADGTTVRLKPHGDPHGLQQAYSLEVELVPGKLHSGQKGVAFKVDGRGNAVPKNGVARKDLYPGFNFKAKPGRMQPLLEALGKELTVFDQQKHIRSTLLTLGHRAPKGVTHSLPRPPKKPKE